MLPEYGYRHSDHATDLNLLCTLPKKSTKKQIFLKHLNIRSEFFRTGLIGLPCH